MILKYYTWNKIAKTWDDTKAYCSICTTKAVDRMVLTEHIHHILSKRNLISLPKTCLSLVDRSEPYTASYHLFAAIAGKQINFGKLEQIPNKLSGFVRKENPFGSTVGYFNPVPFRGRGAPRAVVDEMYYPAPAPVVDWEPRPAAPIAIGRIVEYAQRVQQEIDVAAPQQEEGELLDFYEEEPL
jgi:hypothetical protein